MKRMSPLLPSTDRLTDIANLPRQFFLFAAIIIRMTIAHLLTLLTFWNGFNILYLQQVFIHHVTLCASPNHPPGRSNRE